MWISSPAIFWWLITVPLITSSSWWVLLCVTWYCKPVTAASGLAAKQHVLYLHCCPRFLKSAYRHNIPASTGLKWLSECVWITHLWPNAFSPIFGSLCELGMCFPSSVTTWAWQRALAGSFAAVSCSLVSDPFTSAQRFLFLAFHVLTQQFAGAAAFNGLVCYHHLLQRTSRRETPPSAQSETELQLSYIFR